tara:strand:- start:2506 stop:2670 length:165 start_codon:yes stop_codon:yes gene_type:complete
MSLRFSNWQPAKPIQLKRAVFNSSIFDMVFIYTGNFLFFTSSGKFNKKFKEILQ